MVGLCSFADRVHVQTEEAHFYLFCQVRSESWCSMLDESMAHVELELGIIKDQTNVERRRGFKTVYHLEYFAATRYSRLRTQGNKGEEIG